MRLIWLLDPNSLFETDWLRLLLPDDIEEVVAFDDLNTLYHNGIFVFNHSIDYEAYFRKYEDANIPFAAIHLSDETLGDSVDFYKYINCQFVIRNYHHPVYSFMYNVITIGLGCKSGFYQELDPRFVKNTEHRFYHWCFAGNIHDKARLEAIEMFQTIIPYQLHTTTDGFNSRNNLSVKEYAELLQSSKFALCPIGQGNIDSFRFYEALEAGAIPVVLANTPYQVYPSSYWHAIFPMHQHFPFIMAKDWEDARRQMFAVLMRKEEYEDMQYVLGIFWREAKQYWKKLIERTIQSYE